MKSNMSSVFTRRAYRRKTTWRHRGKTVLIGYGEIL